jgi:glycosyltransferase involved in cell wall biosynthesis
MRANIFHSKFPLGSPSMMSSQRALPLSLPDPHIEESNADLVSIIIPHRNQLAWLSDCLASCFAQTHTNFEIILVDDASDVSPVEMIEEYDQRLRFFQIRAKSGPSAARNYGFQMSRGTYIQYLDADDIINPLKLADQINALRKSNADVALSSWRVVYYYKFLLLIKPIRTIEEVGHLLESTINNKNWFPIMAGLFSRRFLENIGAWKTDLKWNEDRDFRYRVLATCPKIVTTPLCNFIYRIYLDTSVSKTNSGTLRSIDRKFLTQIAEDTESNRIDKQSLSHGILVALLSSIKRYKHVPLEEKKEMEQLIRRLACDVSKVQGALDSQIKQQSSIMRRLHGGLVVKPIKSISTVKQRRFYRQVRNWSRAWINLKRESTHVMGIKKVESGSDEKKVA